MWKTYKWFYWLNFFYSLLFTKFSIPSLVTIPLSCPLHMLRSPSPVTSPLTCYFPLHFLLSQSLDISPIMCYSFSQMLLSPHFLVSPSLVNSPTIGTSLSLVPFPVTCYLSPSSRMSWVFLTGLCFKTVQIQIWVSEWT